MFHRVTERLELKAVVPAEPGDDHQNAGWARELGLDDAVGLLEETLEEGKDTPATLTEMAKSVINQWA